MFPHQAWYVACTAADIDDKPLGRTVCQQRLVFYLTPEEQAANDPFTPCCSRARTPLLVLDL